MHVPGRSQDSFPADVVAFKCSRVKAWHRDLLLAPAEDLRRLPKSARLRSLAISLIWHLQPLSIMGCPKCPGSGHGPGTLWQKAKLC